MAGELDELPSLWSQQKIEAIPVGDIETDREAFQPRHYWKTTNKALQSRLELRKLGEGLDAALEAGGDTKDPIWLIEEPIDQGESRGSRLVVVDGHQRLEAYKRQKRKTVPCQVYRGEKARQKGRMVSLLANTQGGKADLNLEERSDGAWKMISRLTGQGLRSLEKVGTSCREVSRLLGGRPARSTISRMVSKAFRLRQKIHKTHGKTIANDWPWDYEEAKKMDLPEDAMQEEPGPDWDAMQELARQKSKRFEQLRQGTSKSKLDLDAEIELHEEHIAHLKELREVEIEGPDGTEVPF